MNGPFLIERAIFYPLTLLTTLHDHVVGALVAARPLTLSLIHISEPTRPY